MPSTSIIHYDIAAVVIMTATLLSLLFRHLTSGAAGRVYVSTMLLVLITSIVLLAGEVYDDFASHFLEQLHLANSGEPPLAREVLVQAYYALRSLTAPAYLVLIATVSGTSHKLNDNALVRIALWVPMIFALLFIGTNPLHHLAYYYANGHPQHGPLIGIAYGIAIYYSIIGIAWLVRWRALLQEDALATLLMIYPIMLAAEYVQFKLPNLHIEMFITSIAMMMVSAFVLRPELRYDSSVKAESLYSYREESRRCFLTNKRQAFVYLEIVNLDKIRELIGKEEAENVVNKVAEGLNRSLEIGSRLFYLRNGLFCIAPRFYDRERSLGISRGIRAAAMQRSRARGEKIPPMALRTCVVLVPEDVQDAETLNTFVRRFSHLVPNPDVVAYSELSKQKTFALEMALSDVVSTAIRQRSFEVHYQPIWCVKDGAFHSAEALVRLNDPRFGWVSPSLFIPEAERNGSILDIGTILLEKICEFISIIDFNQVDLDYLEVNLSAEQCVHPDMSDELISITSERDVDPRRLNLEITETSSAFSQEIMGENMRRLSQYGFSMSLDDYGTGYSNAVRALSLPVSLVKLDKDFVDHLDDPRVRSFMADTVKTMKAIGKQVLAEGVETEEQARIVTDMGIDYIQGYYYARPMNERQFLDFLNKRAR